MGVDYDAYAGPAAICKITATNQNESYSACVNGQCKLFNKELDSKFCSECGDAIGTSIRKRRGESVDPWDLAEEMDEVLSTTDHHQCSAMGSSTIVWTPNSIKTPIRQLHLDVKYETSFIEEVNQSAELDWFHREYSEALGMLRSAYGAANVTVKWVIFNSMNA